MTSMAPIGRVLALAGLGAVLGAVMLAVFGARANIVIAFDTDPPRLVSGVFPVERDNTTELTFAWTGPDMTIRVPGLDRSREWTMDLRARAGRTDPAANPVLTFYADGLRIGAHPSPSAFQTIRVVIPARPQRPRGAIVRMEVSTTVVPGPTDARVLGVMIDEVKIAPAGFGWPPLDALASAALGVAILTGAIGLIASAPAAAGAALVVSAGQGVLLARGFAPYTTYPATAAQAALWIAAGVALIAVWIRRKGAPSHAAARFVIAFSAAALFLKLLVLLHPHMPVGDAMFHAHRFQGVLAGNLYFTSIAPGNYTFPYPPGFYLFAAAFARFVTRGAADMTLLRLVALTVDIVAGATLYVAVRRTWNDPWTGAVAVVVYQMVPLQFRIFTVGNLTNAFAQSISVFAFAILAASRMDRILSANVALLTLVLALAFMSHTSTFPILFSTCVLVAALVMLRGNDRLRRIPSAVVVATLVATALAIGLYYAHFGETYRAEFSRIRTETVSAAPDAGGRDLATRARSVPRYLASYLGVGALMLATVGTWDLLRRGARDRLTLTTAGWALSCLVFLVIGILTPVDMRYYLASIPAVAIAAAAGTSALWRHRPARAAAIALLIVICGGGVITWYGTL
jgi:hypothetical protein